MQPLPSPQLAVVPVQVAAVHASLKVQALPSSQGPPAGALTHVCAAVSQLSLVHALASLQVLGARPMHRPPSSHASAVVHTLPSSHGLPFARAVPLQVPLWQPATEGSEVERRVRTHRLSQRKTDLFEAIALLAKG